MSDETKDRILKIMMFVLLVANILVTVWAVMDDAINTSEIQKSIQTVQEQIDSIKIPEVIVTESPRGTSCETETTEIAPFWYTVEGMALFVDQIGPRIREYPEVIAMMEYFMVQDTK